MTDEIVETLVELGLETLAEWKKELLEVLRKGEITSAATGGGVQYARSRGMSVQSLLSAIRMAEKRILQPEIIPSAGQVATVIFTRAIS
jgi:hypothetical protein